MPPISKYLSVESMIHKDTYFKRLKILVVPKLRLEAQNLGSLIL
jgi:hypothetical protein